MIKRTLYFGNPAYLSKKNEQLLVRLPEVEINDTFLKAEKEARAIFPVRIWDLAT